MQTLQNIAQATNYKIVETKTTATPPVSNYDEVLDDHNKERVNKIIKVKDQFTTLLVLGPTGIGKTYVIKKLFPYFYFCPERDFKQRLTAGQLQLRQPGDYACRIELYPLEALYKKQGVIYDDYGVCEPTPAYLEKMMYRIDRVDTGRQTIITSNLSIQELKKRDERLFSRIMQNTMIVQATGRDRRTQNTITL